MKNTNAPALVERIKMISLILELYKKIKLIKELKKELGEDIADKPEKPTLTGIDEVILHHTATKKYETTFSSINSYHKIRKDWKGRSKSQLGYHVGYTYLFIPKEMKIYQARNDTELGWHTKYHNRRSIGIGVAGNYEHDTLTEEEKKVLADFLDEKLRAYGLSKNRIKPHSAYKNTLCPGQHLYAWMKDYQSKPL